MYRSVLGLTAAVIVCVVMLGEQAIAQADARRDGAMHGGMRGSDAMLVGELVSIDDGSIVLMTDAGEQKRVRRAAATSFVRETGADRSALVVGATVLVVGPASGSNSITPIAIRILEKIDDSPRQRGGGRRPADQFANEPVIGAIIQRDPLRIQQTSGQIVDVRVTGDTKIFHETKASPAELSAHDRVRVLAPPQPGTESREARKVIVLTEAAGRMPGAAARKSTQDSLKAGSALLAPLDRSQQRQDFFFGAWLGRGPLSDDELDRAFQLAQNLGLDTLLVEFKWDYVEPSKGAWRWIGRALNVERVIELARRYNISIIPYFDIFMPWGEKIRRDREKGECEGPQSGKGQFQAPDPDAYAEYVFTVVDKLRKSGVEVRYVELDNEESNINDGYRSWNCFVNASAKQIKTAENTAYDRIKAVYPEIQVSSTSFSFPGTPFVQDRTRKNSFVKAYFGDAPKPKFDFLALHETLSGSGNPSTTTPGASGTPGDFRFGSYHDAYDTWRKVLDHYGYRNAPIINLESAAVLSGLQDAQLIQRAVFALTNASRNGIRGWVLSQLAQTRLNEGASEHGVSVGVTRLDSGYQLKEGYFGYHTLLSKMRIYQQYEGKVQGDLNSGKPWIEKFGDGTTRTLYIAYVPYSKGADMQQRVTLQVGAMVECLVTRSDASSVRMKSDAKGFLTLDVGQHPVFIEPQILTGR